MVEFYSFSIKRRHEIGNDISNPVVLNNAYKGQERKTPIFIHIWNLQILIFYVHDIFLSVCHIGEKLICRDGSY